MKILNILAENIHTILIVVCIFLFLNLLSMCSTNKSNINLKNQIDTLQTQINKQFELNTELQLLKVEQKLNEQLLYQKMLIDKQLKVDSIQQKLDNTINRIKKIEQMKNE